MNDVRCLKTTICHILRDINWTIQKTKENAANKKVIDLILDMGLTNTEFYYDFSFVPPSPVCNYAQYINIIVQA